MEHQGASSTVLSCKKSGKLCTVPFTYQTPSTTAILLLPGTPLETSRGIYPIKSSITQPLDAYKKPPSR